MTSDLAGVVCQPSRVVSSPIRGGQVRAMQKKLIFAFLLGALTVTGFAPFHLFPVPVITLALLFHWWRNSATPLRAALLGFCFGLGLFGAGVSWIYVSLHDFGAMPLPLAALATFLFCAFLALFPALVGWMLTKLRLATPASSFTWALAAAALWMLSEWVRGWIFTGFPWLALGYSQVPVGPLAGFAPVAGVYGVSLGLAVSAAFLCLWLEQGWRTRRAVLSFVLPLAAIFSSGFGLQQIDWTTPQGEPVTVSLLQGNISQDLKWRADRVVNSMEVYARLAQQSNSRLIIMPETALPLFRDQAPPAYLAGLADHARKNNGDILVGMAEYAPAGSSSGKSGGEYYNTLFSFGASAEQHYRKHHLVPFGEFIPLKPVFGWIIHVLHIPLSDFSRGGLDQKPLALAGQRVAVNICYEDVFGEEIISQLPQATLLANVSNDAWFGRSIGPQQHLQISQTRALETGRYMLRATNTGVTAIIDQRGVVLQEAEAFTTLALHGTAQGYGGATPYVRFGNALALGLAGLFLLIGLLPAVLPVFRGARKNL